jgi:hypothetical protein
MRKVGILTLFIMVALVLTLTFTVGAASPKAHAAPVAAAPASPVAAPVPPPHPHIDEALEAMRSAKHHLETADRDFHGHRVKSIEHLNQAIHEAEECMREP